MECISLGEREQWVKALTGIEHSFFHTWEHCYAMHLTNRLPTYLFHSRIGQGRLICPIIERKWGAHTDIFTPFGFSGIASKSEVSLHSHSWLQFVQTKGYLCGYIGLNPVFDTVEDFVGSSPVHYNNVYVLNLEVPETDLFNNLHPGRKGQIKKWKKEQGSYILDRDRLGRFFLTHYNDFMVAKNASKVYHLSKETLSFLLSLDTIFLVGAGKGSQVEAVSVFAFTPYVGDYLFNISLPQGKQYAVPLLWYGINYLRSLRVPLLNLGGGVSTNDSLAAFKERFGAQKQPLRCLKQVYDQETYQKLCDQAGVDANDRNGYFPAYRQ